MMEQSDCDKDVRYESMRRPSKTKRLFSIHQDLEKRCTKEIQSHAKDYRMAIAAVNQAQVVFQQRCQRLEKAKANLRSHITERRYDYKQDPPKSSIPQERKNTGLSRGTATPVRK